MRTIERTRRRARGATIGADLRAAPSAIDFAVRGRTFTADVTPDPGGGYCATVRGHGDCFTEADTLPELRESLAEVTELMLYGADRQLAALRATAGRWDDGRDAEEIIAEIEGARTAGRRRGLRQWK